VRGVSFQLNRGEVLGIVGESGSGKSVTSLAMMGLLAGSARASGSVRLHGTELRGASDKALSRVRGQSIAMMWPRAPQQSTIDIEKDQGFERKQRHFFQYKGRANR